jgi:hypothetical protein
MATDYDVNDPSYSSKQVMENADYACSSVPSSNLLHGVECDPKERPLDVMYTTPRAGQLNFSTLGNFQIASQGCSTAGTTLGELWVSYDITFYKKQLQPASTDLSNISFQGAVSSGGALLNPTTIFSQKSLTILQVIGTGTTISLPPSQGTGRFVLTIESTSDPTNPNDFLPTLTNLVQKTVHLIQGPTQLCITYDLTGPGGVFTWPVSTAAISRVNCAICEVPPTWTP